MRRRKSGFGVRFAASRGALLIATTFVALIPAQPPRLLRLPHDIDEDVLVIQHSPMSSVNKTPAVSAASLRYSRRLLGTRAKRRQSRRPDSNASNPPRRQTDQ